MEYNPLLYQKKKKKSKIVNLIVFSCFQNRVLKMLFNTQTLLIKLTNSTNHNNNVSLLSH